MIEVRRAADRAVTRSPGVLTRHAFSGGRHYDPANTSHGLLLVHDEHLLEAGAGFPAHRHRDTEIVTWVVSGALAHEDATGARGVLRPGTVQRTSAGRGLVHSELAEGGPVRFLQAAVLPGPQDVPPSTEVADATEALAAGGLVVLASGRPEHAGRALVGLGQPAAALLAAQLDPGEAVALPAAPYVHLHVVAGEVALDGAGALAECDAARLSAAGPRRCTALAPAQVLVWETHVTRD